MTKKVLVYELNLKIVGDLWAGAALIPTIKALGATHIWLTPIYPSPEKDYGYDIADYCAIDSRFGTLSDFDFFVEIAHNHGLKVMMDMVINHTSIDHRWFTKRPDFYIWNRENRPGWKNVFDDGPAWEPLPASKAKEMSPYWRDKYYLHLFSREQADLNWFPGGRLNRQLVTEFQEIVEFWTNHGVDGFRLDVPQSLNKDLLATNLSFADLMHGERAFEVLDAIFPPSPSRPELLGEVFDPTFGNIIQQYHDKSPVDYIMNVALKDTVDESFDTFQRALERSVKTQGFALDLESHDSPRFTSRTGLSPEAILPVLFRPDVDTVVIYTGQELGLENPTKQELPDDMICQLDAQTAMRHFSRDESLDTLRPTSRANARVPIAPEMWARQEGDPASTWHTYRRAIKAWREGWLP